MSEIQKFNQDIKNQFLQVMQNENYPESIKKGIKDVMTLVKNNTVLSEIYPEILQEIPMGQSYFVDMGVQFETHFTPHRKLRQTMLELDSKLGALDAAKNGHHKTLIKLKRLRQELEVLETTYNKIEVKKVIGYSDSLSIQSFFPNLISVPVAESIMKYDLNDQYFIKTVLQKLETRGGDKLVELEETERAYKSNENMIKDAALKVIQLQNLAEKYKKEVQISGLSYEESEFVYLTMFFTAEAERQLRTGDHNIDRGTFMAVSQTPDFIRKKILWNISWLREKIFDKDFNNNSDFFFRSHAEILTPNITKSEKGDLEVEGMSVSEYLGVDTIKLIAKE